MSAADKPTVEFSLVLGGPVYRFYQWSGLSKDGLDRGPLRLLVFAAITWLPLLLLSLFDGHAYGDTVRIPFLSDITGYARFLVALPALLFADKLAHKVIAPRIKHFVTRNIVRADDLAKFETAVASVHRIRDSAALEGMLLIVVYTLGIWIWANEIAASAPTWYANSAGTDLNLTLAGYWLIVVSLPIFQFFLLRWYVRLALWFVFLFRVSRLNLNLIGTHSDRAGGIGFLGQCAYGFGPVLFAQGALLSGLIASEVVITGKSLTAYKFELMAFVILFLTMVLGPLMVFSRAMVRAKWRDLIIYGALASKYVEGFDRRWIGGVNPRSKALLGADDIQSLADLSNSYAVLQGMRFVPFDMRDVIWLTGTTILPLFPLVFFLFSLDELFDRLVKIIF